MHPIGSDLWPEISVGIGRKHSLSPVPSASVNTLLTHINHSVTLNRRGVLPVPIRTSLCLSLPSRAHQERDTAPIVEVFLAWH